MADQNTIERIIKLVLDRQAAEKAAQQAKEQANKAAQESAKEGEKQLDRLKNLALKVGSVIAGVLALRAVFNFGKEAVAEAADAEKVWGQLANTVKNAGGEFQQMEASLRSASEAFMDATTHSGEDYAKSLNRLITLTGDVEDSTKNMGVVANIAAQFFDGDLGPAVDAVGKIMNGSTRELRQFGIVTDDARKGLELLAQRSMNAAQQATETFTGKVQQLTNAWDDLKQSIGRALIEGSNKGLPDLVTLVKSLTKTIDENKDAIKQWAKDAVAFMMQATSAMLTMLDKVAQGLSALDQALADRATRNAKKRQENIEAWNNLAKMFDFKFGSLFGENPAGDPKNDPQVKKWLAQADALNTASVQWDKWAEAIRGAKTDFDAFIKDFDSKKGAGSGVPIGDDTPHMTGDSKRPTLDKLAGGALPKVSQLNDTMKRLNAVGDSVNNLGGQYAFAAENAKKLTDAQIAQNAAMQHGAMAADQLGAFTSAAMQEGVRSGAFWMSKMNKLEALQQSARAIGFALFGRFDKAAEAGSLAATHASLALMWGAFASSMPSGGGGASGGAVPASLPTTTAMTQSPTFSRDTLASQSSSVREPSAEVTLYLVGPGFDALNPKVQSVVRGAAKAADNRFGPNARTRILRTVAV